MTTTAAAVVVEAAAAVVAVATAWVDDAKFELCRFSWNAEHWVARFLL